MTGSSHFLFYATRIEEGMVCLDSEESRHVFSVLRNAPGKTIMVTDGVGSLYECTIGERLAEGARCPIVKTMSVPRTLPMVRVCIGLPDKDVFEDCAENLASLGADEIVPLVCDFCQKSWWESWDKHAPRITKKMITGIKQARVPRLPHLYPPMPLAAALDECKGSLMLLADENGEAMGAMHEKTKSAGTVSCFIGPPGGFSPKEQSALATAGAVPVRLSKNRLRTELAAVLLCGIAKAPISSQT